MTEITSWERSSRPRHWSRWAARLSPRVSGACLWFLAAAPIWVSASGCKQYPTIPTYEGIGGTNIDSTMGISQGVALYVTLTIKVMENFMTGALGGSYQLSGRISQSGTLVPLEDSGTISSGSIAPGAYPLVTLTIAPQACPGTPATFSGSVDDTDDILTLQGPLHILNSQCQVVLTYPTTFMFCLEDQITTDLFPCENPASVGTSAMKVSSFVDGRGQRAVE